MFYIVYGSCLTVEGDEMSANLIVIAGPPLAGKTTLGRCLKENTKIHYCDSDNLRAVAFGVPTHEEYEERWKNPEHAAKLIGQDMILAYRLLHEVANLSLEAQRSLIISAAYSSKASQQFLKDLVEKHKANLRLIVCKIKNETREEIEHRMRRDDDSEFVYGLRTWEDYQTKRPRYEWPNETGIFSPDEVLVIDTGMPIEYYVGFVTDFIYK